MTSNVQPPPSAELFATALIADRELREEVIGDLTEEYHRLSASASPPQATQWYWSQLVRSAIPLSTMAVSRGGWRGWTRHLFAVLAGSATMYVILVVGTIVNGRLRGVSWDSAWPWASQLRFGHPLFGTLPPLWLTVAISLAVTFLAGIVSSYVAASVGRRSPLAPAMTLCTVYIGLLYGLPLVIEVVVGMRGPSAVTSWGFFGRLGWMLVGVMVGVLLKARMLRTATS